MKFNLITIFYERQFRNFASSKGKVCFVCERMSKCGNQAQSKTHNGEMEKVFLVNYLMEVLKLQEDKVTLTTVKRRKSQCELCIYQFIVTFLLILNFLLDNLFLKLSAVTFFITESNWFGYFASCLEFQRLDKRYQCTI
jgi:positive regulator of sigma E activity